VNTLPHGAMTTLHVRTSHPRNLGCEGVKQSFTSHVPWKERPMSKLTKLALILAIAALAIAAKTGRDAG
jgi:hypothetical protein